MKMMLARRRGLDRQVEETGRREGIIKKGAKTTNG